MKRCAGSRSPPGCRWRRRPYLVLSVFGLGYRRHAQYLRKEWPRGRAGRPRRRPRPSETRLNASPGRGGQGDREAGAAEGACVGPDDAVVAGHGRADDGEAEAGAAVVTGPAVRVARPTGPDLLVPVETGLVANGWIEITARLDVGENIRLPA
jgi:hypothetical protein